MDFILNILENYRAWLDPKLIGELFPLWMLILAIAGFFIGLITAFCIWFRSARRIKALETARDELRDGDIIIDGGVEKEKFVEPIIAAKEDHKVETIAATTAAAGATLTILDAGGDNEVEVSAPREEDFRIFNAFDEEPEDADDLTLLEGVDEEKAAEMRKAGIYKFSQLKDLGEEDRRKFGFKFGWPDINWGSWGATAGTAAATGVAGAVLANQFESPKPSQVEEPFEVQTTISEPSEAIAIAPQDDEVEEDDFQLKTVYDKEPEDADDLTQLEGIDAEKAEELRSAGIYKISQLEELDDEARASFGKKFNFPDINWGKWGGIGAIGAGALGAGLLQEDDEEVEFVETNSVKLPEEVEVVETSPVEFPEVVEADDFRLKTVYDEEPEDADDLTQLEGIDAQKAEELHSAGIYKISQLEELDNDARASFAKKFNFPDINWGKWGGIGAIGAGALGAGLLHEDDEEVEVVKSTSIEMPEEIESNDFLLKTVYDEEPEDSDDLTQLEGIDAEKAEELRNAGIYKISQLEELDDENRENIGKKLKWGDWGNFGSISAVGANLLKEGENAESATLDLVEETGGIQLKTVYDEAPEDADDFTLLEGIDDEKAAALREAGIYKFSQLEELDEDQREKFGKKFNWPDLSWGNWGTAGALGTAAVAGSLLSKGDDGKIPAELDDDEVELKEDDLLSTKTKKVILPGAVADRDDVKPDWTWGYTFKEKPEDADDLSQLEGISEEDAARLNSEGVYTIRQLEELPAEKREAVQSKFGWGDIDWGKWGTSGAAVTAVAVGAAALSGNDDTAPVELPGELKDREDVESDWTWGYKFKEKPEDADDLTQMEGVTAEDAEELNREGVYTFRQLENLPEEKQEEIKSRFGWGDIDWSKWGTVGALGGAAAAAGVATIASDEEEVWEAESIKIATPEPTVKPPADSGEIEISETDSGSQADGETVDPRYGIIYQQQPDKVDDLTEINGIGNVTEQQLNGVGIYKFEQIAKWDTATVDAIEEDIQGPGRVSRNKWIEQANEFKETRGNDIEESEPDKPGSMSYLETLNHFDGENVDIKDNFGVVYSARPKQHDDLKRIKGVGKIVEGALNSLGVYRFKQIANWNDYNVWAFGKDLAFPGRIAREKWVSQAADLAELEDLRIETEKLVKTEYAGQNVKADRELGLVYTQKPEIADDLTQLEGIDEDTAKLLNSSGIYTIEQVKNLKGPQQKSFASRFGLDGIDWSKWTALSAIGAVGAGVVAKAAEATETANAPVEAVLEKLHDPSELHIEEIKGIFGTADTFKATEEQRVVFIMDVSRSLTPAQLRLSKAELSSAVNNLPESALYQVIFFSGPTWFAHQRMSEGGARGEDVVISDGDEKLSWQSGFGGFEYNGGNDNLPGGEWREATPENIASTLEDIEAVGKSYGTTWHLPLTMALNLEPAPESIYFLTDGETARQDQVAEEMIELANQRGGNTKINTIALMVPGASVPLHRIAAGTGGEYSLVIAGGKVLQDEALREYLEEKDISLDD